ncbi:RidA family protein [Microbacterium murale]|uniref:Reactive intermediate/imine deaminase n=1 Tax=Microbacterium murale TaxID=1081040 RepID=A0ABQ1RUZ4_9MICO|nr:RidA family protein [Microbacterium murale]GGD78935.1 reactive intermediate/imine deaminase [Microbacterium murale]
MTIEFIDAGLDAYWSATLASATGLARPPFTPAVKVSGAMLFTSGQTYPVVGESDPRPPAEVSLADQTRACLLNLERIVIAAGGQRTDIVSLTIHNTMMSDQDVVNNVYTEFFGEHRPARTHVEVRRLADPDLLIEITAVAAPA